MLVAAERFYTYRQTVQLHSLTSISLSPPKLPMGEEGPEGSTAHTRDQVDKSWVRVLWPSPEGTNQNLDD